MATINITAAEAGEIKKIVTDFLASVKDSIITGRTEIEDGENDFEGVYDESYNVLDNSYSISIAYGYAYNCKTHADHYTDPEGVIYHSEFNGGVLVWLDNIEIFDEDNNNVDTNIVNNIINEIRGAA